jgi:nitroreductase
MNFSELAKTRYSVRNFQDRPVEKADMDKILSVANLAPTGCNYQPQRIYVVNSEENIAKLNQLCRCIFGAKTVLIFTYRTDEEWHNPIDKVSHSGVQDVSIVASHVMFEAWELGIGTCWVNYFSPKEVEKAFNLPENEKVVLLMPIGYPSEDAKPLEKMHFSAKPIEDTVRFI